MRWFWLLLGLGCAGPASPEQTLSTKTATVSQEAPQRAFLESCVQSCEQRQAMRAVGAEVIRSDCERRCAQDWRERVR